MLQSLAFQIFVLLDPLASFPFLIKAHSKKMNVRIIAVKAVVTAFLLAVIMALLGPLLFSLFGIGLDSFRIAGGFVLFLLGLHMVMPQPEADEEVHGIDTLTTIIATPMLTGPGTISFITIRTYELGQAAMLAGIAQAFILVGITFFLFTLMIAKVNPKIIDIISRILGLFLMAVAVEMISKGALAILNL